MIEVKVKNIGIDSITGSPVLMLVDINNEDDIYPIWIGLPEAEGIIINQAGIKTPRPLTYELVKNIIQTLGATVKRAAVIDYKNGAYIAELVLEKDGEEIKIDSRPSDAINLALRFNAPVYLDENVVQKINLKDLQKAIKKDEPGKEVLPEETVQEENVEQLNEENISTVEELERETTDEVDKELEEFRKLLDKIKPEDFANPDLGKNKN